MSQKKKFPFLFFISLWVGSGFLCAQGQQNCTLEPADGSKQSALSDGVKGRMTWNACTSLSHIFVFEWPKKRGFPASPQETLMRASALLKEWQKTTGIGASPFGDLASALAKKAAEPSYVLGEDFPVTSEPGWDGASVTLSTSTETAQLTLRYWANP